MAIAILVHPGGSGWRNLKKFKATLTKYILDKKSGVNWSLKEVQKLNGLISYYNEVQPEEVEFIIKKYNDKFKFNIRESIKYDLKPKEGIQE